MVPLAAIQLHNQPVPPSQLGVEVHQGRAQATAVGMIQLSLQRYLRALIHAQKTTIREDHRVVGADEGDHQATGTVKLGTYLSPCLRHISTGIPKPAHITGNYGAALWVGP
jgi:hypothetical protein